MFEFKCVGKLTAVKITPRGKGSYATVHLEDVEGEYIFFAHDEILVEELKGLALHQEILIKGTVGPRDPKLGSTKPYFLNILYFERL